MRSPAFLLIVASATCWPAASQNAPSATTPTMADNFEYRVSWGDLGSLKPAPIKSRRALRVAEGSETLLRECLDDPATWRRDPLIYRFGHSHAFSTLGCRERQSPSLHVVFYRNPDGSRQAWIHFDLSSPSDFPRHAAEVLQNRLTLGRTSQEDVYRALVRRREGPDAKLPPRFYNYKAEFERYARGLLKPVPLIETALTGGPASLALVAGLSEHGFNRFGNQVEANLARGVIEETLEFGTAAVLGQHEAIVTAHEGTLGHRAREALYHSFFVPGRNGDEFAFPRLAAAVGTAWITSDWHPWNVRAPGFHEIGPREEASLILSTYVARSFWREFEPDLKRGWIKTKQRP